MSLPTDFGCRRSKVRVMVKESAPSYIFRSARIAASYSCCKFYFFSFVLFFISHCHQLVSYRVYDEYLSEFFVKALIGLLHDFVQ